MESWRFDAGGEMRITDFENSAIFVSENAVSFENQRFEEMCPPQIVGSSLSNPVMVATHNAFSEEYESSSKKLNSIFSSSSSICQVHGCNMKFVSCKYYNKKHKVCELHSKSAKVIVNGIQQRFCQQCNRFHILSEFDNGKRSCRRKLADHNQRRRKRHGITKDDPANRKLKGSTGSRETSSSIWHIQLEDEVINDLRSMSSITDVQLQYPSLHGTGGTDHILTEDPTPVLSPLPSQSYSASSSYSSRTPQMIPSSHNVHQASGGSNNMNPLVGFESMNHQTQVWSDDEPTMDLLQLSLELKRVEHQKEIIHMKCPEWCEC
ncbi:hypothetical protein L1987_66640 [Smallanthus sonchifolius]|uniref:Uncharacterized protein n=1 Tax=Smallanthus sonchifolius TaxID=185202 RepID=A0ACB9BY19_9ASTR|nr:hypothetical protein L1987_66640 [Smallanthus sonchifolius]